MTQEQRGRLVEFLRCSADAQMNPWRYDEHEVGTGPLDSDLKAAFDKSLRPLFYLTDDVEWPFVLLEAAALVEEGVLP